MLACRSVARVRRVVERWWEAEVREAVKAARASAVWWGVVVVGAGGGGGGGVEVVVGGWVDICGWWGGGWVGDAGS